MFRKCAVLHVLCCAPFLVGAHQASAQDVAGNTQAQQEQARIRAEREAAEREAREEAALVTLETPAAPTLGAFPEETPCFTIETIDVEGAERGSLRFVPGFLDQYRGRCAGAKGLDHILRNLQAEFLDRGLITTRAGLPEQDMSGGMLKIVVVPGIVSAVRTNGEDKHFTWDAASPVDAGDLVSLRSLEQGLEQMRRIPGREVTVDLTPGDAPGETILDVTLTQKRPLSGSVSVNNFAGATVGRWQGSAQLAALGVLGASELISISYNQRIDAPGIPANSKGTGISASVPLGWWTFGVSGSSNRYGQSVVGEVATFETRGKLDALTGFAERVIHRDQTSRTAARVAISRRWARNYINDIEIGIQRQDLSDIEIGLTDRRSLGQVRLDSALALRIGTGLFGAQDEPDDRPDVLPSARYRIFTADFGVLVPLGQGFIESWRGEFHGQISGKPLYGSDVVSVGGPYSVRGFDSDTAELGKSGWFIRQEVGGKLIEQIRPYALFDFGQVDDGSGLRGGVGIGLRAAHAGFTLDAFAALPAFGQQIINKDKVRFGLTAGWGF